MTTLLLHPIGLDRTTWDDVLIPHGHAIDLPGHGANTSVLPGSLGSVADRVMMEAPVDAGPVDIVGVSLGGMVALHAALRHPRLVRSIVVACAPAATPADAMLRRADETQMHGMEAMMPVTLARWFSPDVLEAMPGSVRAAEYRLRGSAARVIAHYWRLIAAHDVAGRLRELALPVTVLAGSRDVSVPPSVARMLAGGISNARYVELPAAHMLHLEAPHLFADAVHAHLETL